MDARHLQQLKAALDRDAALSLLKRAVACSSITGAEAEFVALLETEMRLLGLSEVASREFLPGRPNVWGTARGKATGPHLLFIGHTDTVHVDGWREHWAGTSREDPFGGAIVAGEIWGRGTGDLKAGIAASLSAFKLLKATGIQLKGTISYAFVGDEESGQPGTGLSLGIKHFVETQKALGLAPPDFAIYVEPTRLDVYTAQMGFFIAEVKITGRSAYFGVPEQGRDALEAAHVVLSALWRHRDEIAARTSHKLVGRAHLLVTEIRGGGYIAVPGECSLSLIRKLLPGEMMDTAVAEFEQAIRSAPINPDISIAIAYPAGRDRKFGGSPGEIDDGLPPVRQLQKAVQSCRPNSGKIAGAPYWSELPILTTGLGCPGVYCAPGDISNCHTLEERVELEEYFASVVAYALFAAAFCGVTDP